MTRFKGHTEGPWKTEPAIEEQDGNIYHYVAGVDGVYPAMALGFPDRRITEANARLIAAAPDLLRACEAMRGALRAVEDSKTSNGELGGGYYTLSGDTQRKARAALALANEVLGK